MICTWRKSSTALRDVDSTALRKYIYSTTFAVSKGIGMSTMYRCLVFIGDEPLSHAVSKQSMTAKELPSGTMAIDNSSAIPQHDRFGMERMHLACSFTNTRAQTHYHPSQVLSQQKQAPSDSLKRFSSNFPKSRFKVWWRSSWQGQQDALHWHQAATLGAQKSLL